MENKAENEAAIVARPVYKPLPPHYEPVQPTITQKRKLYRIRRKKR